MYKLNNICIQMKIKAILYKYTTYSLICTKFTMLKYK